MSNGNANNRRSWAVDDVDYTCLTTLPMPSRIYVHDMSEIDGSGDETSEASSGSKRAKLSNTKHKRTSPIKAFFGRFKSEAPPTIAEETEQEDSNAQTDKQVHKSGTVGGKKKMKLLSELRFKLSSRGGKKFIRSRNSSMSSPVRASEVEHRRSESQDSGYSDTTHLSDVVEDTALYLDKMIFTSPDVTPTIENRDRSWTLPGRMLSRTPSDAGSRSLDGNSSSLMADMLMSEVGEKMKYKHMLQVLTTTTTTQNYSSSTSSTSTHHANLEIAPVVDRPHFRETEISEPMEIDDNGMRSLGIADSLHKSSSSDVLEDVNFVLVANEFVMDTSTHRELISEIDELKDRLLALQSYLADPNSQL